MTDAWVGGAGPGGAGLGVGPRPFGRRHARCRTRFIGHWCPPVRHGSHVAAVVQSAPPKSARQAQRRLCPQPARGELNPCVLVPSSRHSLTDAQRHPAHNPVQRTGSLFGYRALHSGRTNDVLPGATGYGCRNWTWWTRRRGRRCAADFQRRAWAASRDAATRLPARRPRSLSSPASAAARARIPPR